MEFQEQLSQLIRAYDAGQAEESKYLLESLKPVEIANLLESTPPKLREILWDLCDDETRIQILEHLGEEVRDEFLETMDTAQLLAAAEAMDTDDFADLLQSLPEAISDQVLSHMDRHDRARFEAVLSYPEDSAGGLMNVDTVTVRPRHTLEIVLRYLRLRKDLPDTTDALIVVNSRDEYLGMLPITKILTTDPSVIVREVMDGTVEPILDNASDTEVARLFSELDLVSAPVVNAEGKLVGRITIDDVVDVIIEDASEAVLARAGLDIEEDIFAPVQKAFGRRAVWLGINLITAVLAAAVINVFEETIVKVVALAVLMPIVTSMGGIAGTQTLTLVIRGISLGQVGRANLKWLIRREFLVAALNGMFWALLIALSAAALFQDTILAAVLAIAMVLNIVIAAIAGCLLPSLLTTMRIDPAIAGGVILTTVTDVCGFFIFLGLAT
ncbi:MAG: magnesium transporter [Proteobacteria bacterium]|nr:magnesium transporter [Pseudomonadota bacterium]